jgi:hypothetical protein
MKVASDKLKVANQDLSKRNEEYEKMKASSMKMTEEVLKLPSSLHSIPTTLLQNMIIEIVDRHQRLVKQYDQANDQLEQYQTREQEHQQLIAQHHRLMQAHQQQSSILQQLQQDQLQTHKYTQTIQIQEQLIQKLQVMLEKKISTKKRVDQLPRSSSPQPQAISSSLSAERIDDSVLSNLEAELTMKDIRIEALNEQLLSSTKQYAAEVASQRIRIIALEMALEKSITTVTSNDHDQLESQSQSSASSSSPLPSGKAINAVNALRKQSLETS